MKNSNPAHRTAALLFLSIFAFYLALSPMETGGRGYIFEEIDSGMRILESFNAWVKGRPVPDLLWSRHGPVPVLFDLPFIKLGKLYASPDFAMSMSPIFFTTALLVTLFLWLRRLASPGMSLLLTWIGAFGTLLWPYAYIGLETKQSFFVLLSGYLALANGHIKGWPKLMLFSVVSGLAMTVKSTGIVLWPVFAYLIYVQFSREWRPRLRQALATVIAMGGVWAAGHLARRLYWVPLGGAYNSLRDWLIESPLQFFTNAIGVFGSPTKGLFVFAPVLLLSVFAVPRALRAQRGVTIFALLVTGSILGFISLLIAPADEVWGPRYMHVAVAPLLLCIGAVWPQFVWKQHIALLALAGVGIAISFLGAFFYYGSRDRALYDGGQNTMEWLIGDPVWNEVTFNAREFRLWLNDCPPTPWTPTHIWVWEAPPGSPPWKAINLQDYCQPQSYMLRKWHSQLSGLDLTFFRISVVSLVVAFLASIAAIWRTVREVDIVSPVNRRED